VALLDIDHNIQDILGIVHKQVELVELVELQHLATKAIVEPKEVLEAKSMPRQRVDAMEQVEHAAVDAVVERATVERAVAEHAAVERAVAEHAVVAEDVAVAEDVEDAADAVTIVEDSFQQQ